jgi:hypothetical protein
MLYSLQGYRYCDLLISVWRPAEARERAKQAIDVARRNNWVLDVALDILTLGRAHLALASMSMSESVSKALTNWHTRDAADNLNEAVERLRTSGQNDHFSRGFIARAAFRRVIGDWKGAARDLDEAHEIAEPGPMRLLLCDIALEGARLALAQREGFAPLNGLVATSPPPPALPHADVAAALKDEGQRQLDVARKLVAECGYHRRDEELAELDAVIGGGRRFADLPPRV